MSMLASCAGHDLTIELRDDKARVTLLRRTILVKIKTPQIAILVRAVHENQAKWSVFC
jgi:hypothetical protein